MVLFNPSSSSLEQSARLQPASVLANEMMRRNLAAHDTVALRFGARKGELVAGIHRSAFPDRLAQVQDTQAFKFAALIQARLTYPVGETVIAKPVSNYPQSQDWNGGVHIHVVRNERNEPTGTEVMVGRTRNQIDRGGETWVRLSTDGGKTWTKVAGITKQEETRAAGKPIASVERPYSYQKMVGEKVWIVLGTCVAEAPPSKRWDIHERQAPLDDLSQLNNAHLAEGRFKVVLAGNSNYAYKDGVPVASPPGDDGVYLAVTRHHLNLPADTQEKIDLRAVNADTVLCKLNASGTYDVINEDILLRESRGDMDKTCNRLSSELVFPDGSRFWACDIRNAEPANAAKKTHIQPGNLQQWQLGDFDEVTSFSVARWPNGSSQPEVTPVDAILGRSWNPKYPTLRYLGIATRMSPEQFTELQGLAEAPSGSAGMARPNDPALVLTYEKAGWRGAKRTYQQIISRKDLVDAMATRESQLFVNQDPGPTQREQILNYLKNIREKAPV